MMQRPLIVGITGGIGAGKTEFSNGLRQNNIPVIDADIIARKLADKNDKIQQRLKKIFGNAIITKSGKLRRRMLGRRVFSDTKALHQLNRIMKKPLNEAIIKQVEHFKKTKSNKIIAIDMATLYETGLQKICDKIIVIDAPIQNRIRWLIQSRNWGDNEITGRIQSQWDVNQKKIRADIVVQNEKGIQELKDHARTIYRNMLAQISE
jgi:dephospho-CoA kinase